MNFPESFRIAGVTGDNGMFKMPLPGCGKNCLVQASVGMGWEHVSVSMPHRCLTWDEMCYVKGVFFEPEDVVVQFHPAESEYVNMHPFCLHLWRPEDGWPESCVPDSILVGLR